VGEQLGPHAAGEGGGNRKTRCRGPLWVGPIGSKAALLSSFAGLKRVCFVPGGRERFVSRRLVCDLRGEHASLFVHRQVCTWVV